MTFGPYVVLEGPDGCGKTTLADGLMDRLLTDDVATATARLVHWGPPNKLAYEQWIQAAFEKEGPVVFDRLHLGSIAYGKAFRGMYDVTDHENWLVEGAMMSRGLSIIHTDIPREVQDANIAKNPDPNAATAVFEDAAKRDQVKELYHFYFGNHLDVKSNCPPVLYDFTRHGDEDVPGVISDWVSREIARRDTPFLQQLIGLGNPFTATRVLVGDELHGVTKARARAKRFCSSDEEEARFMQMAKGMAGPLAYTTFPGNGSGRYLHMCFRMAGFTLQDTFVMNSRTWEGTQLIEGAAEWFADKEIVALGANAEHELTNLDMGGKLVPYRRVPHPQWFRRFHYSKQSTYAKQLAGEAEPFLEIS